MAARPGNDYFPRRGLSPMDRFLTFCEFDPATGCVLWTGGRTQGRGHNVPYGSFWFEGRRWFAHRWAAKYIHGLDIEDKQVDHCCSEYAVGVEHPNTLCVQHLQAVTAKTNRDLQARRFYIHLQVGLISYAEAYGELPHLQTPEGIPFLTPPTWLNKGLTHGRELEDCPF